MRILAECGATEEGRQKGRFLNMGALRVEEQHFSRGRRRREQHELQVLERQAGAEVYRY